VPDEEVFYLVAFLRNALPSGPVLESILEDNARILSICEQLRGKQYLPRSIEEAQAFVQHKQMFDPQAILAPGQNIFPRNPDWMQLSASI
jgi:cytokinin dehydrogenase